MEAFYIDKLGNEGNEKNEANVEDVVYNLSEEDEGDKFLDGEKFDLADELPKTCTNKKTDPYKRRSNELLSSGVDKLLKKSALSPGLERQHSVPSIKSKNALKVERKELREKTKGKRWFDIPATEVTKEIRNDFALLKMRSVLDSKNVYKKNDITTMPKYFQVGTVIESPADFYSSRIPKSQRKKTIVDELLADAEFKTYQKKKFKEIMDDNRKRHFLKKSSRTKNQKKKSKKK